MPALGLLLGQHVAWLFGGYGKDVGGAILILTGGYTIFQERFTKKDQTQHTEMTARSLLITALALSIVAESGLRWSGRFSTTVAVWRSVVSSTCSRAGFSATGLA